jgi:hypothetical protein
MLARNFRKLIKN